MSMPTVTPLAARAPMAMELFDAKVISSPFHFHMASVTKNPQEQEHRVDRAFLYMRHLRWWIAGRYYSQIEVTGLYAEINGTAYQDGFLSEGADICVVNYSSDPMCLDSWVALGARQAAEQFPQRAGRFNICLLGEDGKPIIPETLTKEGMEQAFRTIVTSFHTEEKQEQAQLRKVEVEGAPDLSNRAAVVVTTPQAQPQASVMHSTGRKVKKTKAAAASLPPM